MSQLLRSKLYAHRERARHTACQVRFVNLGPNTCLCFTPATPSWQWSARTYS